MKSYQDVPDTELVMEKLRLCKTMGDVKSLIEEIYPTWFVATMDKYCDDYPLLEKNWHKICEMSGVQPMQIVIVDSMVRDDNHTLTNNFAECLTRAGFSVRRKQEYFPCEKCGAAIPSLYMWGFFKDLGHTIPEKWNKMCRKCQ